VSPYDEISENATRTYIALLASTFCISLKSASGQPPYLLGQFPINPNSCLLKKGTDERLAAPGCRDQLCEHGAAAINVPRRNAASRAFCAAKLSAGSLSHKAITTFESIAVVIVPSSRAAIL